MTEEIQQLREIIKDYEQKKKLFLEWVEQGEPNPVFRRLYKRKFTEIFEQS